MIEGERHEWVIFWAYQDCRSETRRLSAEEARDLFHADPLIQTVGRFGESGEMIQLYTRVLPAPSDFALWPSFRQRVTDYGYTINDDLTLVAPDRR